MKKKDIVNLIRYYSEGNSAAFRDQAYQIAVGFRKEGDEQLGEYILALLSNQNAFIPQSSDNQSDIFKRVEISNTSLPLPTPIFDDLMGIANACRYNAGINKFLFSGDPGTGKTESAKQLARILDRELFEINFDLIIDSKLGQTSKNIADLFDQINRLPEPDRVIILFDEIDSLAMGRTDSHDLREMGRATSSVFKGLDGLNDKVILLATTNLVNSFDKAFLRRFDKVIDFNRYTQEDLFDIAFSILNQTIAKFTFASSNKNLFKKILGLMPKLPYPGNLRNMIRSSVAFSNPSERYDYLRNLFFQIKPDCLGSIKELKEMGFSLREIEILSKIPKSTVARNLAGGDIKK